MNEFAVQPDRSGRTGRIWLIPTPIGEDTPPALVLPRQTLEIIFSLDYLIAERARTARAVLKAAGTQRPIQDIEIRELNEHTADQALPDLLKPVLAGRDAGLMSEAGCPAVADPGARLVALAHQHGVRVIPLVGPSAILMALMASGLNGQNFAFAGYLPQEPQARKLRINQLQARSAEHDETELFIETPYRNQAMFEDLLKHLAPETLLMVARSVTQPDERIETRSIGAWRAMGLVELPKTPTVFGLQASATHSTRNPRPRNIGTSAQTKRRERR